MSQTVPSTDVEWREFIRGCAARIMREAPDGEQGSSLKAECSAGQLGNEPASVEAIVAVERRLGVRLPPSYRSFLLVSNGWAEVGHRTVEVLRKVDRIGWFPEMEPKVWTGWSWPNLEFYDERLALIKRCLLLSDSGNGDFWLLSADKVDENGEWAAYEWCASDLGELVPHDNFAALLVSAWDARAAKFLTGTSTSGELE